MKLKISAALATFNEEKNIVDCLSSLKQFADEIVVVDGNSSDRTAELAKLHGAKVISVDNKKMFHINKNIAFNNCQNEWIFLIDADEIVTYDLANEVKKIVNSKPLENGFWVNRKNWFLGDFLAKGGAYPDSVIRLFRRSKGKLPEISVHEQVEVDGKVGRLKSDIVHFADPTFERYLRRADRYTTLTSENFSASNTPKNVLYVAYYFFIKPLWLFVSIYLKHKGYKDGFRGFVWALFSAFHFFYAYAKYYTSKT